MSGIGSGDDRDLSGRVVIVTGAGQGIGRQYALSFAAAGAIPIVAELNGANARRVADEIASAGGRALAVELDVADAESCRRMAAQVMEKYGRIDVLLNNAAIFSTLRKNVFDQIPLDEWESVLRVNVTGPFLCARAVAPAMRAARWGRIINVSTSSVLAGTPNYLHYVTSKAALFGMTNGLARELGQFEITVNSIVPSATTTEIEREGFSEATSAMVASRQCIPRGSTPQDIVGLALFLASPASAFITGQTIAVNGGLTHG
jgi:NAD(P)-dependent dehydrogenase (short-subunit alcohol dehydrogenase family)